MIRRIFEQFDLVRCRIGLVGRFVNFEYSFRQSYEFIFAFDSFPVESSHGKRVIAGSFPDVFFHVSKQAEWVDDAHYDFLDRDYFGIERDHRVLSGEKRGLYLAGGS